MQKQIQKLMDKPMDRKEFLACVGKGFLVLIGVSAMVKSMASFTHEHNNSSAFIQSSGSQQADHGFGTSKFGV